MKRIVTVLLTFLMTLNMVTAGQAATTKSVSTSPKITASAGIVVDAKSGQVLYEKNANQAKPIASMSKVLSAYLILKSIKDGQMSWNQKVKVSANLAKVSKNPELTNVPLTTKDTYTVKSLLDASMIESANAAIMALGVAQAGSSKQFVDEMRATVRKWGITDAKLYNACGLQEGQIGTDAYPNTAKNDENEMSAIDMAKVAMHVTNEFPEIVKIASTKSENFKTGDTITKMATHNDLLAKNKPSSPIKFDGLKTGTSDKAKACFTGTGTINGERVISVVLGSAAEDNGKARFTDTNMLWQYVIKDLKPVKITKNQLIDNTKVTIPNAKSEKVILKAAQSATFWLKKSTQPKLYAQSLTFNSKLTNDGQLKTPLKKDTTVATAEVVQNEESSEFITDRGGVLVKLQTKSAVKKAGIFELMGRWVLNLFR